MFSSNLFEKILVNSTGNFDTDDKTNNLSNDELRMSIIGPLLWSSDHFIEEISSEEDEKSEDELIDSQSRNETLMATKNKNTDVPESQDESQRRKRKVCTNRMTAAEVCSELSKANVSPHLLIAPHIYGESFGAAAHETQPFQIIVHPQVGFLSDFHGHMCEAEVIGLLAGKWDGIKKKLYVQAAFPCTATERVEDDGSTDVELDPVAELAVRELISSLRYIYIFINI
jgi:hypothetical protein